MDLESQTIIAQLNASPADRIAALRSLKNDVVGDIQKKTLWVQHGLIPHIVGLLLSNASEQDRDGKGARQPFLALDTFTEDETAQLQALQLLASFATGMPRVISYSEQLGANDFFHSFFCSRSCVPLPSIRFARDTRYLERVLSPKRASRNRSRRSPRNKGLDSSYGIYLDILTYQPHVSRRRHIYR